MSDDPENALQVFKRLWLWPLVIAAVSFVALFGALVYDNFLDVIAGLALGIIGFFALCLILKK